MSTVNFEVRDNELDAQGVVNNANYFIYMAHARHKYAQEIGINFVEMLEKGQNLFLISSNIEFKQSLKSNDCFSVITDIVLEGKIRFAFKQQIVKNDGTIIANGYNVCVCIDENNRRRPYIPQQILDVIKNDI